MECDTETGANLAEITTSAPALHMVAAHRALTYHGLGSGMGVRLSKLLCSLISTTIDCNEVIEVSLMIILVTMCSPLNKPNSILEQWQTLIA